MSQDQSGTAPAKEPGLKTVVTASAAGTAFEWYDFFIFGSLAAIISKHFFTGVNETAGFILALASFAVGFAVRPLGALVFGHFGDRKGRKGAFLVTIILMGVATVGIGLLPTFEQAGILAPILLVFLRILQGFALGGEYGGAAIFVAEHAPDKKRGEMTSWIQTSAAFGLLAALGVIFVTRTLMGEAAFSEWGWRIPFVLSLGLLLISIWIRTRLSESPAFKQMEAEGAASRAPFKESFTKPKNFRRVVLVLFGIMTAQGVVWYTSFFYSQFFLERTLKVEPATVNLLIMAVTVVSAVLYVFFGWLSDRVGRKPVMLFGILLAAVAFFPAFQMLTRAANPDLATAISRAPVVVYADAPTCSLQFDPVGKARFSSACDLAKGVLTSMGIPYSNIQSEAASAAVVRVGDLSVAVPDGHDLSNAELKTLRSTVETEIKAALATKGYPLKADPAKTDLVAVFLTLMVLTIASTALYGPQAAALVEIFPTRVRYTAMSLPYNVGTGWFGGFLPTIVFALVAATGNIYYGLWYPVIVAGLAFVVAFFFLKESKGRDLASIED